MVKLTVLNTSKKLSELLASHATFTYAKATENKDGSIKYQILIQNPSSSANSIFVEFGTDASATEGLEIPIGKEFSFEDYTLDQIRLIASASTDIKVLFN
jgi:hypothetical protein